MIEGFFFRANTGCEAWIQACNVINPSFPQWLFPDKRPGLVEATSESPGAHIKTQILGPTESEYLCASVSIGVGGWESEVL